MDEIPRDDDGTISKRLQQEGDRWALRLAIAEELGPSMSELVEHPSHLHPKFLNGMGPVSVPTKLEVNRYKMIVFCYSFKLLFCRSKTASRDSSARISSTDSTPSSGPKTCCLSPLTLRHSLRSHFRSGAFRRPASHSPVVGAKSRSRQSATTARCSAMLWDTRDLVIRHCCCFHIVC